MKKSTLITTIAMIVVVVVALSTATYAWFTSSQATYANVEMKITADQNLTVLLNGENPYNDNTLVAFTAQDFTADADATDNSTGIRAGIWVPNQTTVLNQKPSDDSSFDACYLSGVASNFASGIINTATNQVGIDKSIQMAPTLLHVKNNMGGDKDVTLTIYVGFADDAPSKYAASGFAVYLADYNGLVACTKYCLPSSSLSISTEYALNTFTTTASVTAQDTTKVFTESTGANNHTASTTSTAAVSGLDSELQGKLTGCANYYTLSVKLGTYASAEEHNYLTYIWLDGGYLNDNAKGSTIAVAYAFTGAEPQSQEEP